MTSWDRNYIQQALDYCLVFIDKKNTSIILVLLVIAALWYLFLLI